MDRTVRRGYLLCRFPPIQKRLSATCHSGFRGSPFGSGELGEPEFSQPYHSSGWKMAGRALARKDVLGIWAYIRAYHL
jgi:hypothetical protein